MERSLGSWSIEVDTPRLSPALCGVGLARRYSVFWIWRQEASGTAKALKLPLLCTQQPGAFARSLHRLPPSFCQTKDAPELEGVL